jgi:exopolysaccharide biosynthesis WecB/TagA/CpsF family protein
MRQDRTIPISAKPFAHVDGQALNVATLTDAVRKAISRLEQGMGFTLFTLNLDHLHKRRSNPEFREAYGRATFVLADGAPIVALARRQGAVLSRATGSDLIVPLCRAAAAAKMPVYLLGTTDEVLERAAEALRAQCPGLDIRGCESPPLGFDPHSRGADATGRRIAASGARLCFVALSAPKQEIFADRMASLTPSVGYLCIGAGLDFLGGAQRRAPVFMQRYGLEWLWRVALSPGRLGARYARCAVLLARLLVSPNRPVVDQPRAPEPSGGEHAGVPAFEPAFQPPQVVGPPRLEVVYSAEARLKQTGASSSLHLRDVSAAG